MLGSIKNGLSIGQAGQNSHLERANNGQGKKIYNALKEMRRMSKDVMGDCKMRWPGAGR